MYGIAGTTGGSDAGSEARTRMTSQATDGVDRARGLPTYWASSRRRSLAWIERVRCRGTRYGTYPLTSGGKPNPLSSSFAALARELLGGLGELTPSQRAEWIELLQNSQGEDGLFRVPGLDDGDFSGTGSTSRLGGEYLRQQLTFYAYSALDALGAKPRRALGFVRRHLDREALLARLGGLDWRDAWRAGNEVMFIGCFLAWTLEDSGDERYRESLAALVDFLRDSQDPATGYWGTDKGASLKHGMAGAIHLYMLFDFLGRDIPFKDKIIDSTLSLQESDGLFSWYGGGGTCDDLDAVETLAIMGRLTDHRWVDVEAALKRVHAAVLRNQRPDGGFCWAARPNPKRSVRPLLACLNPLNRLGAPAERRRLLERGWHTLVSGKETSFYSGWKAMPYVVNESDMFSTWFRPLTLALIHESLTRESAPFGFRRRICFGWRRRSSRP